MSRTVPYSPGKAWGPARLLRPLVPAYAAAVGIKNLAYARGWMPVHALQAPVVSIGNLSVGGSGKTPLVIRLAQLLLARGCAVDVLSRGYRRSGRGAERVILNPVSGGLPAARFGDEPVLIAQAAGVPVFVGADRYAAGLLAEGQTVSPACVHLLDDGFQHRRLRRAVDIVVLHPGDLGELQLPAGRLREPWGALSRASIAVVREEDGASEPALRKRGLTLPVWRMRRELALPQAARTGHAVAFGGIAHPEAFFTSLRDAGVALAACRTFADHHGWTEKDLSGLAALAHAEGAHHLLTTEKDLVRLSPTQRHVLEQTCPVLAVPLRVRLLHEDACVSQLLELLAKAGRE